MACLFCKIVAGDIPSDVVYESEEILAFKDINPQAPVHILVIPKKHIANFAVIEDIDHLLLSKMMLVIRDLAKQEGIDQTGYRVSTNHGEHGGQEVDHLHFHLLGGKRLGPIG